VLGIVVENIEFDAVFRASRAVTLEITKGGFANHSGGFVGCSFRNAGLQLLHIGGEIFRFTPNDITGGWSSSSDTEKHWSFSQDLAGTRFVRCFFQTAESLAAIPASISTMALGVLFRADESLNLEFQDCVFRGPANPMFFSQGGRFCLQNCFFETIPYPQSGSSMASDRNYLVQAHIDPDIPRGLDVYTATPFTEASPIPRPPSEPPLNPNLLGPGWVSTMMMKNVSSRSPMLYASSVRRGHTQPLIPSIVLINVTHTPPVPRSGEPVMPAIVWGIAGFQGAHLVLMGCKFVRPAMTVTHPNSFMAPVKVDWMGITPITQEIERVWRMGNSSPGHILDLGNQVVWEGRIAPALAMLAPTMRSVSLPLLERCTNLL
jgi:hypothetical protein